MALFESDPSYPCHPWPPEKEPWICTDSTDQSEWIHGSMHLSFVWISESVPLCGIFNSYSYGFRQ